MPFEKVFAGGGIFYIFLFQAQYRSHRYFMIFSESRAMSPENKPEIIICGNMALMI